MKTHLLLAATLATALLPMTAMANRPGYGFVRAEAGSSRAKVEDGDNDSDSAFSVRGGYYFSPNFAAEAFYANDGERDFDDVAVKLDGFGLGVTAKQNFGDDDLGFFVGGRVGVQRTKVKVDVRGLGGSSESSTDPYIGASVGYDFSPSWGLSLNYDYTRSKPSFGGDEIEIKTQTLTLAAEYRF